MDSNIDSHTDSHIDVDPIVQTLIDIREARGLTVHEVARDMGAAVNTFRSWERGDRIPPIGKLHKWAAVLGGTIVVKVQFV